MSERSYVIQLKTPLGVRHGTMLVKIIRGELSGYLNVMNHAESFQGRIDENGHCTFRGHMVTLMRVISYEATGILTETEVDLSLRGERNLFQIKGYQV